MNRTAAKQLRLLARIDSIERERRYKLREAGYLAAFPDMTVDESRDVTLVITDDDRKFWLPSVLYRTIQDSAFSHGIAWAKAHREGGAK